MTLPENRTPEIRGWCPGALRPMRSGDGWIVRIAPRLGRLTPAQAIGLAELAQAHGNGEVSLSNRANLQIRGVPDARHAPLIAGLDALGLVDRDAEAEARRHVLHSPFSQAGDESERMGVLLEGFLVAGGAPPLPGKFGFAVDLGAWPVLQEISADIRFERALDGGMICVADGAATGARVTPENALEVAGDLARWFIASGGVSSGRGRMVAHLARGAHLPDAFLDVSRQMLRPRQPVPEQNEFGCMVALALGRMRGDALAELGRLGPLRLTPWRMLLLEGCKEIPAIEGLITDPRDPLLRVIACTGAPGCPQGLQATEPLARALASQVGPDERLHVAGCVKSCAHPGRADWTLLATAQGFDVIRNGTVTTPPVASGIAPDMRAFSGFF